MSILIGNINNLNKEPGVVYVRVDRSSPLGNPFLLEREGWRGYVIQAYREWLRGALFDNKTDLTPYLTGSKWKGLKIAPKYRSPSSIEVQTEFHRIVKYYLEGKDIYLLCWCHPLACHAQVIIEMLEAFSRPIESKDKDDKYGETVYPSN